MAAPEHPLILRGTRALVTGAARGLGRSAARALAGAGAALTLLDCEETELQTVAPGSRRIACDLTDRTSVRKVSGEFDFFLHCAAVLPRKPLEETSEADWDRTLAVNLTAAFLLLRSVRVGSVLLVSSRAGVEGFAGETAYCASKFGIEGLARALAAERPGIPTNTVTPGARIKPTGLSPAEEAALPAAERTWGPSEALGPAFVAFALLAGKSAPTGRRFRADRVAERARRDGLPLRAAAWEELAA